MDKLDDKSRAEIVFVGSTLGPLFLHDPEHDAQVVAAGLEALATLDVEAAAKDWPFVSAEDAERALALMHEGLAEGQSDEPEDHIGTMLVLLAWLAEERPELVDEFLRDHLLTWSSHFLEQLEEAAEQPFYEGLANLTRKSLEGLQEECELEVIYPRFYR